MNQEFHAIYEHGVLRPLVPLDLPDSTEVIVSVQPTNGAVEGSPDNPLIGFMANEAELMDAIVEEAMAARESQPFRVEG
jgi:predicted DNA-binding antitoxin AbrB/MazE fold protein